MIDLSRIPQLMEHCAQVVRCLTQSKCNAMTLDFEGQCCNMNAAQANVVFVPRNVALEEATNPGRAGTSVSFPYSMSIFISRLQATWAEIRKQSLKDPERGARGRLSEVGN